MAALTPENVSAVVNGGVSTRVADVSIPARFSVGDTVQMKNSHPHTHTRLARYVRGKVGTVQKCHGVFYFNDAAAHGKEVHQHCYSVKFTMHELWGEGYRSTDFVHLDMFDEYMEKV